MKLLLNPLAKHSSNEKISSNKNKACMFHMKSFADSYVVVSETEFSSIQQLKSIFFLSCG